MFFSVVKSEFALVPGVQVRCFGQDFGGLLLAFRATKRSNTKIPQRRVHRLGRERAAATFVASLYVRTVFDVARPSVVSRILTCMRTCGHVVAALLDQMKDAKGSARFENCETEFRYSWCTRQGSVEASLFFGERRERKVAKYVLRKGEGKWKSKGGRIMFW